MKAFLMGALSVTSAWVGAAWAVKYHDFGTWVYWMAGLSTLMTVIVMPLVKVAFQQVLAEEGVSSLEELLDKQEVD